MISNASPSPISVGSAFGKSTAALCARARTNPTTVEIAQRTLSAICHATGKLQVNDSEELHLIPMTIQVGVKPPKDGYGERNTIRYLVPEAPGQATPPKPAATQPASAPAQSAPARPATAPWNRKS